MPAAWVAAAAAIYGGISASQDGGGEQQTSTSRNDPWWGQQPYVLDANQRAQDLYYKQGFAQQYFPGSTVAGQSPYTQQAIGRMAGASNDPNSLTSRSVGEFGKTVGGDYLRPDSNPYLKGTVDAALGDVQGKVSGLYGARGGNNYGSSAHEEFLGKQLAQTALPIYAQNYQQERARQLNAAQLGPGIEAQGAAGLTQAGAATDAYQQSLTNADKARFDFGQTSPWDTLQRYNSAISGNYGGLQSQSNPYFGANPLLGALGGASAGLGLYNQGKQSGMWGTTNAGGGSGLAGGSGTSDYDANGKYGEYTNYYA